MFKIDINSQKKVFHVVTEGFFTVEEAKEYVDAFKTKVKTIDPSQFTLLINGKDQKTSSADVAPILETAIGLYMQTPFKKRCSVVLNSSIAMQQIKRIGNKEVVDSFSFFESEEEAMKNL
jgi:hypothetical protein